MRWGQITVSILAAIAAGYGTLNAGYAELPVLLIGILTYIGFRWLIAWLYRIRYWYHSKSQHSMHCPNCNRRRRRLRGDWILECKNCGWRPGLPLVRWVTRSIPAIQLRRTIIGPQLVVVVLIGALLLSGATASVTLSSIVDSTQTPVETNGNQSLPTDKSDNDTTENSRNPPAADEDTSDTTQRDDTLNTDHVESLIFQKINAERTDRGLDELDQQYELSSAARNHSRDMFARDFYAHVNPDDEGPFDRANHIGECQRQGVISVSENIHRGEIREQMQSLGSPNTFDTRTEEGIANYVVDGWIHSEPHRENMFESDWEFIGIGVEIEEGKFFATSKFC